MGLLSWATITLLISLVAGGLGFSGVAQGAAQISRVLFGIFMAIAILLFVLIALGVDAVA